MKKLFPLSLLLQIICVALFIVHMNKSQGLGTEFMFYVLLFSILNGIFLLWQSFKNPEIVGFQKAVGIILGSVGFLWLIIWGLFIAFFSVH